MAEFTVNNCHYFRETIDPNATETKTMMAKAAPIIQEKGTVTVNEYHGRKIYTYKGVRLIEDCFGEWVFAVPENINGFPDTRYLEAIINGNVNPLIIGNTIPSRV